MPASPARSLTHQHEPADRLAGPEAGAFAWAALGFSFAAAGRLAGLVALTGAALLAAGGGAATGGACAFLPVLDFETGNHTWHEPDTSRRRPRCAPPPKSAPAVPSPEAMPVHRNTRSPRRIATSLSHGWSHVSQ